MKINHFLHSIVGVALFIGHCTFANADVLSVKAGATYWSAELSGEALNRNNKKAKQVPVNFDKLNLTNEDYNGFWLEFEHPIPVLPNLRLSYSNIESFKRIRNTDSTPPSDVVITLKQYVDTALAFNSFDATLYYEVLDNWFSLDVGLTARKFDGYLDMMYELVEIYPTVFPRSYTELKEVVPMGYLKAEFDVPATGFYLQTILNGVSYKSDVFFDGEAKVGYIFDAIPGMDINIAAGYRVMKLKTINISNLYADAELQGVQVEFGARF